ncbi:MAG: hypothetical protein ACYDDF_09670 [Thermoplasmatota archaeon]
MPDRGIVLAAFLVLGAFAGCLGASSGPGCTASASSTGGICKESVGNGTSVMGLPNATFVEGTNTTPIPSTLAVPPTWRVGEWWTISEKDAYEDTTYTTTQIVAGIDPQSFLVGMPEKAFSTPIMVLHLPGFGQVSRTDLSYDVHNCPFEPLKFPLTEGEHWATEFECIPLNATVHLVNSTVAVVNMTGQAGHFLITYDANEQTITSLVDQGYSTVKVTGHGFGYQGIVTVPHQFRLVFRQDRIGPALNGTLSPSAPTETRTIPDTFDQVSFVIFLGNFLSLVNPTVPNAAAGYYQETVTAPNGTSFQETMLPNEKGLKFSFFTEPEPGGTWKFQHVVAGPGIAEAEGIAYHVYNVDLPSGNVSMPLMHGKAMNAGNSTVDPPGEAASVDPLEPRTLSVP